MIWISFEWNKLKKEDTSCTINLLYILIFLFILW